MASVAPVRWTPKALAQACVQQPLTRPVPADDGPFRARKGLWKLAVRTGRRQLLLGLSGQLPLLRMRIDPACFAARRVADLLGLTLSDAELAPHATQKLVVDDAASRWAAQHALARRTIAVALGGVRAERTYHRWVEVARLLQQRGVEQLL